MAIVHQTPHAKVPPAMVACVLIAVIVGLMLACIWAIAAPPDPSLGEGDLANRSLKLTALFVGGGSVIFLVGLLFGHTEKGRR